jgi:hypothetical protein
MSGAVEVKPHAPFDFPERKKNSPKNFKVL